MCTTSCLSDFNDGVSRGCRTYVLERLSKKVFGETYKGLNVLNYIGLFFMGIRTNVLDVETLLHYSVSVVIFTET